MMCPWGHLVFLHLFGYISIAIIIKWYLRHCEIKLIDNKNLKRVLWSRDDYLRYDGDKDCHLMNLQCKVIPTIAFIDVTKKILTCKNYDGGDAHMIIHACHWNHRLPPDQHDQVLQFLTQSRTVRKRKTSLYSTV